MDIRFDSLKDKRPESTLAGYAYFQKVRTDKLFEGKSNEEAFYFAVEACKRNGYLRGIADREEVILMYSPLFSWEDDLRYEYELQGFNLALEVVKSLMQGMSPQQIANEYNRPVEEIEKIRQELLTV